jgi:hypothetical protein
MNWKFTRPGCNVIFEAGEPFAMLAPVQRGELERFQPVMIDGAENPEMLDSFQRFSASRREFLEALKSPGSAANRAGWQRDYMLGRDQDGVPAPEHQTRLNLPPFKETAKIGRGE